MSARHIILDSARTVVTDREKTYGSPALNMERTAEIITVMLASKLKTKLSAADVVMIHLSIKMGRLIETPNSADTQIDLAGYASLMSEVV